jgi:DNA-directed RNA polymerase subunit RPC12/RpoP
MQAVIEYKIKCKLCGWKYNNPSKENVESAFDKHLKECKIRKFIESLQKIKPEISMREIAELLAEEKDLAECPNCGHKFLKL